MDRKVIEGVVIEGFIDTEHYPVDATEFTQRFVDWIKDNNWSFNGTTKPSVKEK